MKITSQLSEKCQKCPRVNACGEKRMEACAYMTTLDPCMASALSASADYAHAEVLVKHDYRDIKIGAGVIIPLDLEEVKRQLESDFYKANGACLQFGA